MSSQQGEGVRRPRFGMEVKLWTKFSVARDSGVKLTRFASLRRKVSSPGEVQEILDDLSRRGWRISRPRVKSVKPPTVPPTKVCCACQVAKPRIDFGKRQWCSMFQTCKSCCAAAQKDEQSRALAKRKRAVEDFVPPLPRPKESEDREPRAKAKRQRFEGLKRGFFSSPQSSSATSNASVRSARAVSPKTMARRRREIQKAFTGRLIYHPYTIFGPGFSDDPEEVRHGETVMNAILEFDRRHPATEEHYGSCDYCQRLRSERHGEDSFRSSFPTGRWINGVKVVDD